MGVDEVKVWEWMRLKDGRDEKIDYWYRVFMKAEVITSRCKSMGVDEVVLSSWLKDGREENIDDWYRVITDWAHLPIL